MPFCDKLAGYLSFVPQASPGSGKVPMTIKLYLVAVLFLTAPAWGQDAKQNWPYASEFWTLDQGSKIMPWEWFMHLENADGSGLLKDNLTEFGFIPGALKETGLPIGFAKHSDSSGEYVGVTCAACHTGMWKVGNQNVQIEGGPSMLDLDSFSAAVLAALNRTVNDADAFARFAGATHAAKADLINLRDQGQKRQRINAHPVPAGFGRVDAFGTVFNQIAIFGLGNDESFAHSPESPVSFPYLWDTPQEERVQWNGSAPNLGLEGDGSKIRNIGEALGAFAEVQISQDIGTPPKFVSSINKDSMVEAEHWIAQLASPSWPGSLNTELVQRGAQIYQQAKCGGCHQVLNDRTDRSKVQIHLISLDEVQTDRGQADQYRLNRVPTLKLSGKQKLVDALHPLANFTPVDYSKDVASFFFLAVFDQLFNPQLPDVLADVTKEVAQGEIGRAHV